jgi:hypothetical protein
MSVARTGPVNCDYLSKNVTLLFTSYLDHNHRFRALKTSIFQYSIDLKSTSSFLVHSVFK